MKPIVILADLDQEQNLARPGVRELATCASLIQAAAHGPVVIVVPGRDTFRAARDLAGASGLDIVGLDIPGYETYNSDVLKTCLRDLFSGMDPSHILISHTSQGRDYAPGLAVRLGGVSLSGITRVVLTDNQCRFVRPVQSGRMDALVAPEGSPVVLTVQPGAFAPAPWGALSGTGHPVGVRMETACPDLVASSRIRNLGVRSPARESSDLTRARVIVAGGRGMESPQDLDILREMVSLIPRSALGASRPVIDAGWLPHGFQVGITGAVVTPDVYLAMGISGSTQHLAGIKGAGFVVAVNTDPGAAIFNHADLCIVEDFKEFAQAFASAVRSGKNRSKDSGETGDSDGQ
ncbi:MAG: electron transfer flavoprotein subunit alpha/FixB family protein [Pseudomonadota bacterium]